MEGNNLQNQQLEWQLLRQVSSETYSETLPEQPKKSTPGTLKNIFNQYHISNKLPLCLRYIFSRQWIHHTHNQQKDSKTNGSL